MTSTFAPRTRARQTPGLFRVPANRRHPTENTQQSRAWSSSGMSYVTYHEPNLTQVLVLSSFLCRSLSLSLLDGSTKAGLSFSHADSDRVPVVACRPRQRRPLGGR